MICNLNYKDLEDRYIPKWMNIKIVISIERFKFYLLTFLFNHTVFSLRIFIILYAISMLIIWF